MSSKSQIVDFSEFDLNRVIATIDDIRRVNPQRYEMEQLTAIVFDDPVGKRCVGYKDIGPNEFWARGHMPGWPLMPGVIMCEAAAQLCSYFALKHDLLGGAKILGFGGLDEVRFRDPVFPGSRLVIMCELVKLRPRALLISAFQLYVERNLVCEGQMKGIPLNGTES